jgi:chitinase
MCECQSIFSAPTSVVGTFTRCLLTEIADCVAIHLFVPPILVCVDPQLVFGLQWYFLLECSAPSENHQCLWTMRKRENRRANATMASMLLAMSIVAQMMMCGMPVATAAATDTGNNKKLIAYYTNWSQYVSCRNGTYSFVPESVTAIASKLDYIHYAFAQVTSNGSVIPTDDNDCADAAWGCGGNVTAETMFARVLALKASNPRLKVLISIGGWSWNGVVACPTFSSMVSTATSRTTFVNSAVSFARNFGFDGIDIDWEFPGAVDLGGNANDPPLFDALLQELRTRINQDPPDSRLLLSGAFPVAPYRISTMFYTGNMIAQSFDHMSVMTYNLHSSSDPQTGHNTDMLLDGNGNPSDVVGMSVTDAMAAYTAMGIPADKLFVGMAAYGLTFTSSQCSVGAPSSGPGAAGECTGGAGVMSYYEAQWALQQGAVPNFDMVSKGQYLCNGSTDLWLSYDDVHSLSYKTDLIKDNGYAGGMVWSLDLDDFPNGFPLIAAIHDQLANSSNSTAPLSSSSAPSTQLSSTLLSSSSTPSTQLSSASAPSTQLSSASSSS